ncbi:uncharacterized protein LOC100378147 [Saccoglossus kowalevskii]|uniref:Microtubule-associated protein futsch-like n=1 Tax=Saccoglossus kowalevskii TaxID=10224 RepID=A0ABM0MYR9_SACKO|nr:PREDICTED: microtubule-associated protein futsch-like [Saccoglossus kowalevskii]
MPGVDKDTVVTQSMARRGKCKCGYVLIVAVLLTFICVTYYYNYHGTRHKVPVVGSKLEAIQERLPEIPETVNTKYNEVKHFLFENSDLFKEQRLKPQQETGTSSRSGEGEVDESDMVSGSDTESDSESDSEGDSETESESVKDEDSVAVSESEDSSEDEESIDEDSYFSKEEKGKKGKHTQTGTTKEKLNSIPVDNTKQTAKTDKVDGLVDMSASKEDATNTQISETVEIENTMSDKQKPAVKDEFKTVDQDTLTATKKEWIGSESESSSEDNDDNEESDSEASVDEGVNTEKYIAGKPEGVPHPSQLPAHKEQLGIAEDTFESVTSGGALIVDEAQLQPDEEQLGNVEDTTDGVTLGGALILEEPQLQPDEKQLGNIENTTDGITQGGTLILEEPQLQPDEKQLGNVEDTTDSVISSGSLTPQQAQQQQQQQLDPNLYHGVSDSSLQLESEDVEVNHVLTDQSIEATQTDTDVINSGNNMNELQLQPISNPEYIPDLVDGKQLQLQQQQHIQQQPQPQYLQSATLDTDGQQQYAGTENMLPEPLLHLETSNEAQEGSLSEIGGDPLLLSEVASIEQQPSTGNTGDIFKQIPAPSKVDTQPDTAGAGIEIFTEETPQLNAAIAAHEYDKDGKNRLLILSSAQYASAFIDQIFRNNKEFFYAVEPGISLRECLELLYPAESMFTPRLAEMLHDILRCKFDSPNLQCFVSSFKTMTISQKMIQLHALVNEQVCWKSGAFYVGCKELDGSMMSNVCYAYKNIAVRTHYMHDIKYVILLMRDPTLKVIHFMQDPRTIAVSFLETQRGVKSQYDALDWDSKIQNAVSEFCHTWTQNVETIRAMPSSYKDRYKIVRYEDIEADHQHYITKLSKFINVSISMDIYSAGGDIQENLPKYIPPNTKRWELKLNYELVQMIQSLVPCKELLASSHYGAVDSEEKFTTKARALNTLMNEIREAQKNDQ